MNIETIIFCNTFGIILLIMLLGSGHLFSKMRDQENRLFLCIVLVAIIGSLFEMVSFFVDGKEFFAARSINTVSNTIIYMANIIYPVFWVLFVDWKVYQNKERVKRTAIGASIPALLIMGLLIGNIEGGYFFQISADNIYIRGPFAVSVLVFPLIYMVFSLGDAHFGMQDANCMFFPIVLLILPATFGIALQLMFYGVSLIWPCLAIGLVGVYIYKQKEISYTDSLSHIYNRKYMTYILEKKDLFKTACAGIMIDVDHFKQINDKYGHLMGDQAITDTGRIILDSIPKNAIGTRFAGDEFVIILPTQKATEVIDVIEEINYRVKKFNCTGKRPYKLSYSIGYSIFFPGRNTIEEFLEEMDRNMYKDKKEKKIRDWHTA